MKIKVLYESCKTKSKVVHNNNGIYLQSRSHYSQTLRQWNSCKILLWQLYDGVRNYSESMTVKLSTIPFIHLYESKLPISVCVM